MSPFFYSLGYLLLFHPIGIPDDQLGQNFTNETYDPPSIKGPFQFFDGFFCHFWFLGTPGHKTSTLVRII